MKKIYSIALRSLLVALVLAGAMSCVRPEIDGCVDPRGNVRLTVNLDVDVATRANETPYRIENATVYVFDADNKYVASCEGGQYTGEPYEFFLNLAGGSYKFIVWTNQCDRYTTNFDENKPLSELEFFYNHSGHDCATELIPDLLYGNTGQAIEENRDNHVDVRMRPNTYTINIKVKGLPSCADNFDFSITDNNSHYKFDNSIIADKASFTHTQTCNQQGGELNTSIKTLRLAKDRSPKFVFKNATMNEVLFDNCLVKTITDAYQAAKQTVDFDKTFTYNIVLTYDTNMDVTVSVNGWDYSPEDIEF